MLKKSLASIVSAVVLIAGPGQLTLTAAAQTVARGPVTGASVIPTIGSGLNSPLSGSASFNTPTLTPGVLVLPVLSPAPAFSVPLAAAVPAAAKPVALSATPLLPAATKAAHASAKASPLSVIAARDTNAGVHEKAAALNALFENSLITGPEALVVLGRSAGSIDSGLPRSIAASAKSPDEQARDILNILRGQASMHAQEMWWNATLREKLRLKLESYAETAVSQKEGGRKIFAEQAARLAELQPGLTPAQSAEVRKQLAELEKAFSVSDEAYAASAALEVAEAKGRGRTGSLLEVDVHKAIVREMLSPKNEELESRASDKKRSPLQWTVQALAFVVMLNLLIAIPLWLSPALALPAAVVVAAAYFLFWKLTR